MEQVEFDGKEIPITTIPKGTLLFRAVEHVEADYVGRDMGKGKLCIPPNYNVFFYYTPFAIDSVKWYDRIMNVEVCVATKDLKIVSLVSPSKYTRTSRFDKDFVMVPCNSDELKKACFKSRVADPCFRDEFLEEFPDIVGYTSIAKEDADRLMAAVKRGKLKPYAKYIPLTKDDRGIEGTPEVVLYPLTKRRMESIYIDHPESFKGNSEFNYQHIATLNRNCDDREKFMKHHAVKQGILYKYKS